MLIRNYILNKNKHNKLFKYKLVILNLLSKIGTLHSVPIFTLFKYYILNIRKVFVNVYTGFYILFTSS